MHWPRFRHRCRHDNGEVALQHNAVVSKERQPLQIVLLPKLRKAPGWLYTAEDDWLRHTLQKRVLHGYQIDKLKVEERPHLGCLVDDFEEGGDIVPILVSARVIMDAPILATDGESR